mmetsp:Transcript_42513/g.74618  ORF Transcript_42513/g.74618 Transcript_42513/m.74618 type:complete len:214 (-) Transcript_42513:956-1597(-)
MFRRYRVETAMCRGLCAQILAPCSWQRQCRLRFRSSLSRNPQHGNVYGLLAPLQTPCHRCPSPLGIPPRRSPSAKRRPRWERLPVGGEAQQRHHHGRHLGMLRRPSWQAPATVSHTSLPQAGHRRLRWLQGLLALVSPGRYQQLQACVGRGAIHHCLRSLWTQPQLWARLSGQATGTQTGQAAGNVAHRSLSVTGTNCCFHLLQTWNLWTRHP